MTRIKRLLAEYPALSREEAVMVVEAERIVASQEIERLERDIITAENASRYDARHVADLKDRVAALLAWKRCE